MKYVINAFSETSERHYIVKDERIIYQNFKNAQLRLPAVNAGQFMITPGKIAYEPEVTNPDIGSEDRKQLFKQLIADGVTTVVSTFPVRNEDTLANDYKAAKHLMINSPIDFMLGPQIPIRRLTPKLYRLCERKRLSFLKFTWEAESDLYEKAWEWIRNTGTGRAPFLIPQYVGSQAPKTVKKVQKQLQHWQIYAKNIKLRCLPSLETKVPLDRHQIMALGLYPQKGSLISGSDCDYRLALLDEAADVHYDKRRDPNIVALRGKILFVNERYDYQPGFGKEVEGAMPGRFVVYEGV